MSDLLAMRFKRDPIIIYTTFVPQMDLFHQGLTFWKWKWNCLLPWLPSLRIFWVDPSYTHVNESKVLVGYFFIFIPRKKFSSPIMLILNSLFIIFANFWFMLLSVEPNMISSTYTYTIERSFPLIFKRESIINFTFCMALF